ncbi:MAG: hypothetical protein E7296_08710 [Lachnospiraceae bacterium]|jgi:hypothetical protein|nr:hypothetical protein [Lachnospiraceae bacterium]
MKKRVSYSEIYNLTKDVLKLRLKYESLSGDDITKNCELICNAIEKINKTLTKSMLKGIGGVVNNLKLFASINKEISDRCNGDGVAAAEDLLFALELLDDRITDKLGERLYPENTNLINSRYKMADQLYAQAKPIFDSRMKSLGIADKLASYKRIFIFEEDFESMTLKKILDENDIPGFTSYVGESDAYRIGNCKIVSFSEAGIKDEDVLLLPAREALRKYDRACAEGHDIKNILDIPLFDDNKPEKADITTDKIADMEREIEELLKSLDV